MEKRLTMFLACLFLSLGMAMAQTQISGTVVSSEDGLPIIGASVMVDGTKNGAATDMDGKFTLTAPAGSKITVSYIGMKPKTLNASAHMMSAASTVSASNTDSLVIGGSRNMSNSFPLIYFIFYHLL